MEIGYFLSNEGFGPQEFVGRAVLAEERGSGSVCVQRIGGGHEDLSSFYSGEVIPRL